MAHFGAGLHLKTPGTKWLPGVYFNAMHDAGGDVDAQVLLDADLAILGASETDYGAYIEKIRLEYGWAAESEYRQGRRKVLESFLSRPRIYHYLKVLEEPARRNISAEVAHLAIL